MIRNFLAKPGYHLLLIMILGILGYSNTFNVPFQFDDEANIVKNPIIKNLDYYINPGKAEVYEGFAEYPLLINRYIGSLTLALNYKIHGLDVTGYHVVNLLIHLINALLVYWFVQLIFISLASGAGGDKPSSGKHADTIALFTALLFVTHPIQTQAVTYIIQRFASLATMFYLFSIIMYIKARLAFNADNPQQSRRAAITYYLIALLVAVLAMKTKEISFTLPAMIVLFETLFFKGGWRRRILWLVPFVLTMLIIPATLIFIVNLSGGAGGGAGHLGAATSLSGSHVTRLDYLFTEFKVIMTYLRLMFFPVDQNLDYDYPLYHSMADPGVFPSFLVLLLISLTAIYSFGRYGKKIPLIRVIFFGTAWFLVTLSIESSIIPIIDVIYEHRMYLPSFGLFLVISILLVMIIERSQQKWVAGTVYLSVIITALTFTGVTYSRNKVWNDKIVFWQDVVAKSPGKARGYTQLATAHEEKGDLDQALKYFKKASALEPYNSQINVYLGTILSKLGRTNEAIQEFRKALRVNPTNVEARIKLGTAFAKLGRINEAIHELSEGAGRISPYDAEALTNLGIGLYTLDRKDDALIPFRDALRINPDSLEARSYLDRLGGR
jgi:Tfp pilus assembly protein PilF